MSTKVQALLAESEQAEQATAAHKKLLDEARKLTSEAESLRRIVSSAPSAELTGAICHLRDVRALADKLPADVLFPGSSRLGIAGPMLARELISVIAAKTIEMCAQRVQRDRDKRQAATDKLAAVEAALERLEASLD